MILKNKTINIIKLIFYLQLTFYIIYYIIIKIIELRGNHKWKENHLSFLLYRQKKNPS